MVKKAAATATTTGSPTRVQPKRVLEKPVQPKEDGKPTTAAGAQKRTKRAFSSYKKLVLAGIRKSGRGKGAGLVAITEYAKGQLSSRVTRVQTKVKKALEEALEAGLITRDSKRRYKIAGTTAPKETAEVATTTKKKKRSAATKKTKGATAIKEKGASKKRSTAAKKAKKGVAEKKAKKSKKAAAAESKKGKRSNTNTKKEGASKKKKKTASKKKKNVEEGPVGKVNESSRV